MKSPLLILTKESNEDVNVALVRVVCEFQKVFPEDVTSLPLEKEVELSIDLVPGTTLICDTPYRMSPVTHRELQKQLEELLDTHFVHLSVPPGSSTVVGKEEGWWEALTH